MNATDYNQPTSVYPPLKKTKVTVIYPQDARFEIEVKTISGKSDEILETVFKETQGGLSEIFGKDSILDTLNKKNPVGLRSSMVGDVFVIGDDHYVVDNVGFVKLQKEHLDKYLSVPRVDQIMGWTWFRNHYNLTVVPE